MIGNSHKTVTQRYIKIHSGIHAVHGILPATYPNITKNDRTPQQSPAAFLTAKNRTTRTSILRLMHGELREGEADTFFVEGLIDRLIEIKVHIPIIGHFGPGPHFYIHTAG